ICTPVKGLSSIGEEEEANHGFHPQNLLLLSHRGFENHGLPRSHHVWMGGNRRVVHGPNHLSHHLAERAARLRDSRRYHGVHGVLSGATVVDAANHRHSGTNLPLDSRRRNLLPDRLGIPIQHLGVDLLPLYVHDHNHRLVVYSPLPHVLLQAAALQGASRCAPSRSRLITTTHEFVLI
ncbi:hypothetical protein PFISCL1PPCAC_13096, partial [Pristionchus fissidentatus]